LNVSNVASNGALSGLELSWPGQRVQLRQPRGLPAGVHGGELELTECPQWSRVARAGRDGPLEQRVHVVDDREVIEAGHEGVVEEHVAVRCDVAEPMQDSERGSGRGGELNGEHGVGHHQK
jgi:hypothetical protein